MDIPTWTIFALIAFIVAFFAFFAKNPYAWAITGLTALIAVVAAYLGL